jgi:hypothetical protein
MTGKSLSSILAKFISSHRWVLGLNEYWRLLITKWLTLPNSRGDLVFLSDEVWLGSKDDKGESQDVAILASGQEISISALKVRRAS